MGTRAVLSYREEIVVMSSLISGHTWELTVEEITTMMVSFAALRQITTNKRMIAKLDYLEQKFIAIKQEMVIVDIQVSEEIGQFV